MLYHPFVHRSPYWPANAFLAIFGCERLDPASGYTRVKNERHRIQPLRASKRREDSPSNLLRRLQKRHFEFRRYTEQNFALTTRDASQVGRKKEGD